MKNWLKTFFGNIWGKLTGKTPGEPSILDSLFQLALKAVEPLVGVDLDADGKVSAYNEVVATAERLGLKHLKSLTGSVVFDELDTGELLRWLAIARTAGMIAAALGVSNVPLFRVVELIVSQAFTFITAGDIGIDLQKKGLIPGA